MLDLDELERLLADEDRAGMELPHAEWRKAHDAYEEALNEAAPTLLALARAGRRLAMVADAVQSQTVNGRRIADAECMCVADARCPFHEMEASLEAWREAYGG